MPFRRPRTRPTEFALIVAVPLSRDHFEYDVARGSDFTRAYAAQARRHALAPWPAYEPFATLCRSLVDDAADLGVAVTTRAGIQDFLLALESHETVTLVAHSRGPEILDVDIVDVERVRDSASRLMGRLGVPEQLPTSAVELAAHLDAALGDGDIAEESSSLTETQLFARRAARFRQRAEMRTRLEAVTGNAMRGGPGVEFRDGFVGNVALSERIPRVPTLDLTVCDSVLLAECIRTRHSGGVILSNPRPTTPDFRLALYREAVRFSLRHRLPYADAVITLRRHLKGSRP